MLFPCIKLIGKHYFKTNKIVLPSIALLSYLGIAFTIAPIDFISIHLISATMLFYLMVWVSIAYQDTEYDEIEQILLLKVRHRSIIPLSKVLFLLGITVVYSLVLNLYPVLRHIFGPLYKTNPSWYEVYGMILLSILFGTMGVLLGLCSNKRIIQNRKLALLLVSFFAFMAMISGFMEKDYNFLKYFSWIFPPVYTSLISLSGSTSIVMTQYMYSILICLSYLIAEVALYVTLMNKRTF